MNNRPPIITYLIDTVTWIVEALIIVRIMLRFLGANPIAPFVNWVYKTTTPLIIPFEGMFPYPALEGRFVLEFSAFFAAVVYSIIGSLLTRLISYLERDLSQTQKKKDKKN